MNQYMALKEECPMNVFKRFNFVGGRVLKTGIAVFLTALICDWLDWPPMFAVITAIVTVEPTAADSIKKAFVRFPASAIGAAFSVVFNFAFGPSPLTYMLVAVATIIACHRLRLHDGALVAVLTGVAMISTVQDNYFASFLVRLGTTGIGLTVSTLVNLLVIRPDYSRPIQEKIGQAVRDTGNMLEKRILEIIQNQPLHQTTKMDFRQLLKKLESIETLCTYQKDEWKLHRSDRKDMRSLHYEYKKLAILRQIHYHLGNLLSLPSLELDREKQHVISEMGKSMKTTLFDADFTIDDGHAALVSELVALLKKEVEDREPQSQRFSEEAVIFYELLSIHDLLEELEHIHKLEAKHQRLLDQPFSEGSY